MQQPEKPRSDFPLHSHPCGKWAKKVRGKRYYFGRWDDPEGALAEYEARLAAGELTGATEEQLQMNRSHAKKSREKRARMTYLISDGEFFKIGVSNDVLDREAKCQMGNARQLDILALACGDQEKKLHDQFKEHHVRGEWFRQSPEIIQWFSSNGFINLFNPHNQTP